MTRRRALAAARLVCDAVGIFVIGLWCLVGTAWMTYELAHRPKRHRR